MCDATADGMDRHRSMLALVAAVCLPTAAAAQEVPAGAQPRVSTTRTTSAEYVEGAGGEKRYRPNRPLLVAGAATFLGAYGTGVVIAAESSLDADKRLYIPVVGMWLDVAKRPCTTCTTGDTLATISFLGGGVAQLAGLALVGASFVFPEKERPIRRARALEVHVVPLASGMGVGGAF